MPDSIVTATRIEKVGGLGGSQVDYVDVGELVNFRDTFSGKPR